MQIKDRLKLLRRQAMAVVGRDVSHRPTIALDARRLGSDYGGWVVYHHVLSPDSVVYSFGVGEDATFDLALISEFGVEVHAFDPTPKAVEWVATRKLPPSFHFHKIGIGDYDGSATFNAPRNPQHASYTLAKNEGDVTRAITSEVRRLSTIMDNLGHDRVDLLKLDIEGAEYAVIADFLEDGMNVGQFLVEFHHAFETIGIDETDQAVRLLMQHGYRLFYVSPRGEEYSFIHSDRLPSHLE